MFDPSELGRRRRQAETVTPAPISAPAPPAPDQNLAASLAELAAAVRTLRPPEPQVIERAVPVAVPAPAPAPPPSSVRGTVERDARGRIESVVMRADGRAPIRLRIERDHAGGFVGFTTSQE